MATNFKSRCSKCGEIQRSYLRTLEDKRTLLVKLQNEQDRFRKLNREVEGLKRKEQERLGFFVSPGESEQSNCVTSTATDESGVERQLCEVMAVNKKWESEYHDLEEKYNTDITKLKEELQQASCKLEKSTTHVLALESEVMRLAQALRERHNSAESSSIGSQDDVEFVRHQMQAYKEDFSCERRDRERVQTEKESLQEQLHNAQEIITTLTQEMEMYKEQYERSQDEIHHLLSTRRHSSPNPSQPHLQIVYPIVDPSEQRQLQWRQQQQRRGIFTRGPTPAPPSVFYGGDVEVDNSELCALNDGYRTI